MGGAVASASPPGSPHWMGMAPVVIQPVAGMPLSPPASDSDAYAATYTHGEGTERGDHSHQPQGDREAENGGTAASHTDIEAFMSSLKVCRTSFFAACLIHHLHRCLHVLLQHVSSTIFIVAFTCCHTLHQCCRAACVSSSTSSYLHRCLHVLSHLAPVLSCLCVHPFCCLRPCQSCCQLTPSDATSPCLTRCNIAGLRRQG
jgi:hypothetical protein